MMTPLPNWRVESVLSPAALTPLETAAWQAVAYVDVFDYPLTAGEIHRYLENVTATRAEVEEVLANGRLLPHYLAHIGPYYTLTGRESTVAVREVRATIARRLWPAAHHYGRLIASLPFVRMVAVTGSLAMNNADEGADIDYLIVARNGRVWLSRAFAIAIVRLAERRGTSLCPNYILAERALEFPDRNLYTAHEVAQMIPLSGLEMYHRVRQINNWTDAFLPNATGLPHQVTNGRAPHHYLRRLAELPLRTPVGHWLETWEMRRKIHKFQQHPDTSEAAFSPDWCKGHFDTHKQYALTAYQARLHQPATHK